MPKVVIQAGHQNIKNNILPALHGSTGAPGEVAFNIDIANQVSAELRKRAFEVIQTDANFNSDPRRNQDFGLFLAIHYEADVHNTNGYFVAIPDPSIDAATVESNRIRNIISDQYASLGIPKHSEWENANTKFYYMWKYLTAKTPCVLIECGVGWRVPKDSDILNSTTGRPKIVEQIVRGICKAFNVPYDLPTPQPQPDPCQAVKDELARVNKLLSEKIGQLNEANALVDKKAKIIADIIKIATT